MATAAIAGCISACGGGGGGGGDSAAPATANATTSTLAIVGQPAQTATVGETYSFDANVTGGSGNVTFSIQNKPSWATLNTLTGELKGVPDQAGTYDNVLISASDGHASATMQKFSIQVLDASAGNGSATVSWSVPTQNTDGSNFGNPAGFVIHYGTKQNVLDKAVNIGSRTATSYTLTGLKKGLTYYFSVAAVNDSKTEGDRSAVTSVTL